MLENLQNSLGYSSQQGRKPKVLTKAGLDIELQSTDTQIQWRYKGFREWKNLVAIKDLQGADGPAGKPGTPGQQGSQGLPGKDGKDGADGTNGLVGPVGPKGDVGPRGLPGADGAQGPKGDKGMPGKDGREIELRLTDTHVQWRYVGDTLWHDLILLSELQGPKGDPGTRGEQGERGERGVMGYTGVAGKKGDPGDPGPQGDPGAAGPTGPTGPTGATGATGPAGANGANGVGVPSAGTTGQVLAKNSNTDFDTEWIDPPATSTGLTQQNQDDSDATYVYVGLQNTTTGVWKIYRRTRATNVRQYASGSSSYSTNWTGRAGLTYS